MIETIKPPTDNLYKFLALSGLIVFLFFGWAHLKDDLAIMKIDQQADEIIHDMTKVRFGYIGDNFRKLGKEVEAGKFRDEALSKKEGRPLVDMKQVTARIHKFMVEDTIPEEDKLVKGPFIEAIKERAKLPFNDEPERIAILIFAAIGFVIMVVGFSLWYRRVQRPLDEIMRYDLAERRLKAKQAGA
jgi:hypothetical protein